jgi:hypothetical protein
MAPALLLATRSTPCAACRGTTTTRHDDPARRLAEQLEVTPTHTRERSGTPATALVIAELADGSRAYARTADADALEAGEWVGRPVRLTPGPEGTNVVDL